MLSFFKEGFMLLGLMGIAAFLWLLVYLSDNNPIMTWIAVGFSVVCVGAAYRIGTRGGRN